MGQNYIGAPRTGANELESVERMCDIQTMKTHSYDHGSAHRDVTHYLTPNRCAVPSLNAQVDGLRSNQSRTNATILSLLCPMKCTPDSIIVLDIEDSCNSFGTPSFGTSIDGLLYPMTGYLSSQHPMYTPIDLYGGNVGDAYSAVHLCGAAAAAPTT